MGADEALSFSRRSVLLGTGAVLAVPSSLFERQVRNSAASAGGGPPVAATKSALALAATAQGPTMLTQQGSEGLFVFDGSNLASQVGGDSKQGVYVAPASDPTGASGAWVRAESEPVSPFWFMTQDEVADVRAFTYTRNVTAALQAASAAVQAAGGGTLLLPKGGYLVGRQTRNALNTNIGATIAWSGDDIIAIRNCTKAVKISGYGAVLKAADGLRFGSFDPATGNPYTPVMPFYDYAYYGTPYRGMINVAGNAAVTIEGVELDGNSANMIVGGRFGDSDWQVEGHGIWNSNNGLVTIKDVHSHHHPCDGLVTSDPSVSEISPAKPQLIQNCIFNYNGRQAHSLTGGKTVAMKNCDFSFTGQVANASLGGGKLQSSPGAGIDIEGFLRDVSIENCRFVGNWRTGMGAASGYSKRVTVKSSVLEGLVLARYGYRFQDCTILGYSNIVIPTTNEYSGQPTGDEDGARFDRCLFSYDAALSATGSLDTRQSGWTELFWSRFSNCVIDSGNQLLPEAWNGALADKSPVWENCVWRSTLVSTTTVGITGHFRGINRITSAAPVSLGLGPASKIETGNIILNGAGQAGSSSPSLSDGDYGDVKVSGGGTSMTADQAVAKQH